MNRIADFIKSNEKKNYPFVPNHEFYDKTGIKRKRWGMIFRNEVSPTLKEVEAIANYFEANVKDLILFI